MTVYSKLEESASVVDHSLSEQGAANLEHEIVIFTEAERQDTIKAAHRRLSMAQLQQRLTYACESFFVVWLQIESCFETAAGPKELVSRKTGVPLPNVQVHSEGKTFQTVSNYFESRVIMPFIIESVRAFAVIVRTEEKVRQWTKLLWRVGTQ